jgi:hypothetical protein
MKRAPIVWFVCVLAVVALALAGGRATRSAAQETKDKAAGKAATARLPNYYGRVATDEQKPKLREVAEKYAPRIQKKREELQALVAERDAALDEILTAEQRDEIAKLRAAAQRDAGGETAEGKSKGKKAKAAKAKKAA